MADTLTWTDPNGTTYGLDDPNSYYRTMGAQGLWMPPVVYQAQQIPESPLEIPRIILAGPRDVLIPLLIKGVSRADMFDNYETLCKSMYAGSNQQLGYLQRATPNGHNRILNCFYTGGLIGDESIDNSGVAHMAVAIALHASDPFWYDASPTVLSFSPSGPQSFFATPFLPLKLSPSGLSSSFSVINSGDDVAWPIWTIVGPAVNPVMTNTYTLNGATITKTLSLTITLLNTDTLTIKTKPTETSITKQDGSNQFSAKSLDSSLWSLVPGNNACAVSMTGTSGNTSVSLSYTQCYVAP